MLVTSYCWTFALVLYTTWHTSFVCGQSSRPPSTIYVYEFTTVKIPWTYVYKGTEIYEIRWSYKPSVTDAFIKIYSIDGKTGKPPVGQVLASQFEGRLQYTGVDTLKDATLAITRFTTQDEGIFEIKVIGDVTLPKVETTLQVIVLANVTEFKVKDIDIKEGDNVTLSCEVTKGLPSPRIEIRKSNIKINESIGSNNSATTLNHFFSGISPDAAGKYVCKVTTEGYVSSQSFTINVKYAPKISKPTKMQYGCIGMIIQLKCEADGNPKPKINVIMPDGSTVDKLRIELKKFGVYRCEAKNNLGNASQIITVSQAKGKPEKPSFNDCKFDSLTWEQLGMAVTLQFKEKNSEGPWRDVITTPETSYSPKNNDSFSDKKDYEFRLLAENCVGNKTSGTCSVTGNPLSTAKRSSSNAGVIAGTVIGVLLVILIIVIAVVILKKRGSLPVRNRKGKKQMVDSSKNTSTEPKTTNSHKSDQLLYSNLAGEDEANSERPDYSEIAEPDNPDAPTYSNNIPSWV